jgi:hypothetical protein
MQKVDGIIDKQASERPTGYVVYKNIHEKVA